MQTAQITFCLKQLLNQSDYEVSVRQIRVYLNVVYTCNVNTHRSPSNCFIWCMNVGSRLKEWKGGLNQQPQFLSQFQLLYHGFFSSSHPPMVLRCRIFFLFYVDLFSPVTKQTDKSLDRSGETNRKISSPLSRALLKKDLQKLL